MLERAVELSLPGQRLEIAVRGLLDVLDAIISLRAALLAIALAKQ